MDINRSDLIRRLIAVQNHKVNQNVDILTITGFMNDQQVADHLAWYESRVLQAIYALRAPKTDTK